MKTELTVEQYRQAMQPQNRYKFIFNEDKTPTSRELVTVVSEFTFQEAIEYFLSSHPDKTENCIISIKRLDNLR